MFGRVRLVAVAWHGGAVHMAGTVLAAHDVLRQGGGREFFQRAQHLQLFIAHGIGRDRGRRFHGDNAQQLQQMVLQHVAQRARGVVVTHAVAHAQLFGDGDLHVGNPFTAPQRLEQHVAEAQCQQVLHGFLAQVMVDTVDLRFLEHFAHFGVDLLGAGQVAAQRFFQYHARVRRDQAIFFQVVADQGEQVRRRRQVVDARQVGAVAQRFDQRGIGLGVAGVERHIHDARAEAGPGGRVQGAGLDVRAGIAFHHFQEGILAAVLAAHADDARRRRQVVRDVARIHGRQQFAHC
ncbi:hypothetical protein D3C81_370950 [compost metagenome]